jgi:hypothetical protein
MKVATRTERYRSACKVSCDETQAPQVSRRIFETCGALGQLAAADNAKARLGASSSNVSRLTSLMCKGQQRSIETVPFHSVAL